ncbi:hypothetical protein FEM48_Zijuj08G0066800 [Ziziphus jujuba var. spinosa]|uniref:Uncharacterized protein n=1 Tax=Ziziphus jujuba var. spinosa TaxID=714518 RepID=A0A978UXK0_ZIZJJ|nr:hypothetical protein FEM48_Zijuj08G0066800 [Ziziphus jujuba var. spinosa]
MVEIPRNEPSDSSSQDVNQVAQGEEEHQPTIEINSVEQESDKRETGESTRMGTSSRAHHVMLQVSRNGNLPHPIAKEYVGFSLVTRSQGSDYPVINIQSIHTGKAVISFEFGKMGEPSPAFSESLLQTGSTTSQRPSTSHWPISILEPIHEDCNSGSKSGKRKRGSHKAQPQALKPKHSVAVRVKATMHTLGLESLPSPIGNLCDSWILPGLFLSERL